MKPSLLLVLAATIGTRGVWPALGQAEQEPNLVPNGGFEVHANGNVMPDGWRLIVVSDDRFTTGGRSTQAHAGKYCFCVETPRAKRTCLVSATFDLEPNAAYLVSVWLRMDSSWPKDEIRLRVLMNSGSRYVSPHPKVGKHWAKSSFILRTEAGTSSAHLRLYLDSLADRLYIDDVEMRRTDIKAEEARYERTDLSGFQFPHDHPYVEYTPQEIEQIKESIRDEDGREYKIYATSVKPYADSWLRRKVHFFEKGWDGKYYSTKRHCPADHTLLRWIVNPDRTCEMKCPKCGKVYRDEGYAAVARAEYNQRLAGAVLSLGKGYALTGDERYARKAREILLGIAERFKQWGGGGHVCLYHLREASCFLYPCAAGYDYVYDSPGFSAEDHRKIRDDFLRPAGEYFCRHADTNGRMNNRGAIYNRAVMATAFAIKDKGLLDHVLNSPHSGFHTLVAGTFDEDGLSEEGLGYHNYSMCGLSPIAEMACRVGVNVYRDPAYRKVFEAPLRVLLPGEKMMVEQFAVACPKFAELGKPMAFPFDKEDMAHALRFSLRPLPALGNGDTIPISSYNFKHIGYAVLRSGQGEDEMYLSITYGKEAMFMGHAPALKFGMMLYANGQLLTPKGAATYGAELCGAWSRNPLAHNTITADDTDQVGRTEGRLAAFVVAPQVKLMRAVDDEAYPGITLDRTVFLTDRYAVDLFGAHADRGLHRYDLCYRNSGKLSFPRLKDRRGPLGIGYGYQYLTDVKSTRTTQAWAADWRQGEGCAVRIQVLGGPQTETIACTSPSNTSEKEKIDAIVARRWAQATVFASVWEPYREKPAITGISALSVKHGAREVGHSDAVGIKVVTGDGEAADYFLASYTPGPKTYGDIALDGLAACGRWAAGEPEPQCLYLVKGVWLKRGPCSIAASAPATVCLERLAGDQLLLRAGADTAGRITIEGKIRAGVQVNADGKQVEANAERNEAMTFEVVPETSYRISGLAGWKSVRLKGEAQTAGAKEIEAQEPAPTKMATEPPPTVAPPLARDGSLAGKNKVANSGFEINYRTHFGLESPWKFRNSYDWAKFRPAYDYTSELAHRGKYSIRIRKVGWANESTQDGWAEQRVCGHGSEKTYTLSAWVKASDDPTRVRLCIYGFNPKWGNDYEGGVSPPFDVGTQWRRISWTRGFGPGITRIHIMVKREHQVLGGDLWIDDVQLEEGRRPTELSTDAWTQAVQSDMPEKAKPNLVANAGFEEGHKGWSGPGEFCALDPSDPHRGKQCLKIYTGDVNESPAIFSQPIEIVRGARYLVEFWIKLRDITESGHGHGGRVMFAVDRGAKQEPRWWSPDIGNDYYTGAHGWRKLEKVIWAQASGIAQMRLDLRHSAGTVWFDDVSVTMISEPRRER